MNGNADITDTTLQNDLVHLIALSRVPGIGDVHLRTLIKKFGTAEKVFAAKAHALLRTEGLGEAKVKAIHAFTGFEAAEAELAFAEKYKIRVLPFHHPQYPHRLLKCFDAPAILFYRGNADLNQSRVLGIVGTRRLSDYGRSFTENLTDALAPHNVLIVSGLAYGIDSVAHKTALKNNMETIGVVAHGLDKVYPAAHTQMAKEMVESGGLLTEFKRGTLPDKQNFPRRNRIVAGMCDALVVVESSLRGGAMITAEMAFNYNRELFACPGRTTDSNSEGCNFLIRSGKAKMITAAPDLLSALKWDQNPGVRKTIAPLPEMSSEERAVFNIISSSKQVHIDDIFLRSGLSSSSIAKALLLLEMNLAIRSLPGKMYAVY